MIVPFKYLKYIVIAAVVAVIAVVVAGWVTCSRMDGPVAELEVVTENKIAVTPTVIKSVRDIRQWEFVKIMDDEVVDTVRKIALWPDDRLVLVFHGTPRIGIDLSDAPDDWVVNRNDSLIVTLPQPRLLDSLFIDEALTEVFGQSGSWAPSDRESMYDRAQSRMKARALSGSNLAKAREAAVTRFTGIFESLGASHVEVRFQR